MFEKMLTEKSSVEIKEGHWDIHQQWSVYNQCGSFGRDDCIKRQDAVRLLGEMNLKLVKVYEKAKELQPELADELLQTTEVLSYAMWGIRELEPASTVDINMDEMYTDKNSDYHEQLAKAMGGELITLEPGSGSYINPFNLEQESEDKKTPTVADLIKGLKEAGNEELANQIEESANSSAIIGRKRSEDL